MVKIIVCYPVNKVLGLPECQHPSDYFCYVLLVNLLAWLRKVQSIPCLYVMTVDVCEPRRAALLCLYSFIKTKLFSLCKVNLFCGSVKTCRPFKIQTRRPKFKIDVPQNRLDCINQLGFLYNLWPPS